ncbi:MAG: SAM-dependent methyltransferase, partial [Nocardioidaceae bacterium]|nr:SAM-dependent methyltransferase [Nocardioidaceae bacterium]
MADTWVTWREAWQRALYGPDGFYRGEQPAQHFRTSVHSGPAFAHAVLALLRQHDLNAVIDVGAGAGELLVELHAIEPTLTLTAIELRPRPPDLPARIGWHHELGSGIDGLLLANELLDNLPCDVVELDEDGAARLVEVCIETGDERLGHVAGRDTEQWLSSWWPLGASGQRAEVGLSRDDWWADACARLHDGVALAIDYGHLRDNRPARLSTVSYRHGRQSVARFDGHHDVTAHVAVDSLAARVGAGTRRQRSALLDLGVTGARPPLQQATTEPAAYLRALALASKEGELVATPGLGDFWWVTSTA